MSKTGQTSTADDVLRLDSGLEALQSSPEFRGPVEPLDGHTCNEHLALIYENRAEQFAAVVPFVRQGLKRDERCLYVVDETGREEIETRLAAGGVDVDAALRSGDLSFHTTDETYLRGGEFDVDMMLAFYRDAIEEADEDYEGLRVAAETGWILDESIDFESWMEYESKVNDVFEGEDSIALCQYDRDLIPAEILRDLVRTHPHLVYDNTVCHNFYYTPPAEFLRRDEPDRDLDRMLKTLTERTRAKTDLEENHRYLRRLNEVTGDPNRTFEEKLQALFDLGCERFDLELGALNRVDPDADRLEVEYINGEHDYYEPGAEFPLSQTYCTAAADIRDAASVSDPPAEGFDDLAVYQEFDVESYLGTYIPVEGDVDRTFAFIAEGPRQEPFSQEERTYLELMGQWVKSELERRQHDRYQQRLYEITADPDRSFERKLQALFELGCDRFDLEFGGVARVDPAADSFEVEHVSGAHEHLVPGARVALSETYCRLLADGGGTVGVCDPVEAGFDGTAALDEFSVRSYLGTRIAVDAGPDRTFFFVSTDPRDRDFSEAERTFHHLMGQWLKHELNRRQREQILQESYEITSDSDLAFGEKVDRLLELGRELFDLEVGYITRVDRCADAFEVLGAVGSHGDIREGTTGALSSTYCETVVEADGPVTVVDAAAEGWTDEPVYETYGLDAYLGTSLEVDGDLYGTLCFGAGAPRESPFSDFAFTFLDLMSEWISYELERRQREEYLRESYAITSAPDLSFEQKLEELLELGCDRFGLQFGSLTHLESWEDDFRIEKLVGGDGPADLPPADPDDGCFCRAAIEQDGPVGMTDVHDAGWEEGPIYRRYGLETYLGTEVTVGQHTYGTLWFGSTTPRDSGFGDADRTFLELMGQWVSYELERHKQQDRLASLNAVTRGLMDAETTTEASERVVTAATETMDLPATAIALYDQVEGTLRTAAQTDEARTVLDAIAPFEIGAGVGWNAFVENASCRVSDPLDGGDGSASSPVTELAVFPLGRHGVLVTGSTAASGFCSIHFDFAETVAANVRAALDRCHREQQLQEREAALQEQNETLERLTRVNDIIRGIDQALVGASSREAIEAEVCERLAASGPYELAWVGEHDAVAETVAPREWAGADKGYLDDITITTDGSSEAKGPIGRAVATGEPQVVNDVLQDASFKPWRQDALNRGYHATIALPLIYEGTLYGVLNVYARQPGVFDDLEQSVLAELADNIAYAINAVESKKALVSDEVTELEFAVGGGLGAAALAEAVDCTVTHESVVPRSEGGFSGFFCTRGAPAEAVLDAAHHLSVTGVDLVSERTDGDEPVCLFEAELCDASLPATVLHHGGRLHSLRAEDGAATVTVRLAADAAIREFVEMFTSRYPGARVVAKRSTERSSPTLTEFRAALAERLTPRQLEVFQTAYYSGYFEQPRTRTGSEIAATLDISQPTFNSHLRTAQRKLCEQLLDEEPLHADA